VRNRPPEINFDFANLAVAQSDDLGIAEAFAISLVTFVGDEYPIAVGNEVDKSNPSILSLFGSFVIS
jgi:hypothetical protein